ncbi:hypothetical protein KM043_009902 [Ampulex compressa]|nr:hypothetical protein KM043_009902 [Ampulex compressa]
MKAKTMYASGAGGQRCHNGQEAGILCGLLGAPPYRCQSQFIVHEARGPVDDTKGRLRGPGHPRKYSELQITVRYGYRVARSQISSVTRKRLNRETFPPVPFLRSSQPRPVDCAKRPWPDRVTSWTMVDPTAISGG